MDNEIRKGKVFVESPQTIRLIIQQEIGLGKIIDQIANSYEVKVFDKLDERIIFIEETKKAE
jgi:hypothetical protein